MINIAACSGSLIGNARLIYYNTFDSLELASSPLIGYDTTVTSTKFTTGVKGNCMYVTWNSNEGATFKLPTNILGACGTIEVWTKIDKNVDSYGYTRDPRFLRSSNEEMKLEFSSP